MACSDIKLLLLGDEKFAKVRNIHTPTLPGMWPCPKHNTKNGTTQHSDTVTNKRKRTKTICREGRKPGSSVVMRQALKSLLETLTHSNELILHNKPQLERISTRPLRDTTTDMDYSVLNDGYDIETISPKKRKRHSSQPRSELTLPRQAAKKKIEETKIYLSSHYKNLDLEKIMDSQYPALQLIPLSSVMNGVIDRSNPLMEEYITPVLGTLTVHGVTESKTDLKTEVLKNNVSTPRTKTENKHQSATTIPSDTVTLSTLEQDLDAKELPMSTDNPCSDKGNGITDGSVQVTSPSTLQANADEPDSNQNTVQMTTSATEPVNDAALDGVTNNTELKTNQNTMQLTTSNTEPNNHVALDGVTNNTELTSTHELTSTALCGVVTNINKQTINELELEKTEVNAVTEDGAYSKKDAISDQTKPETLPDPVLPDNMTFNDANTMEDEDEAAEALLQLSKSDTLPDDDSELPLGVLPVDAVPVPITLGNQDVLNAIENFKQTNRETDRRTDN